MEMSKDAVKTTSDAIHDHCGRRVTPYIYMDQTTVYTAFICGNCREVVFVADEPRPKTVGELERFSAV